jgi:hypothetical protein
VFCAFVWLKWTLWGFKNGIFLAEEKSHLVLTPLKILPTAETHSKGHLTASKDTLLLPTINHNSVVQLRVA